MSRNWKVSVCVSVLALSMIAVGCNKKKPITPPEEIEIEESTPEVTAPPVSSPTAPPIEDDIVLKAMSEGLQQLNETIRSEGLIGDVYFEYDQYELSADARDRLARNADFMKKYPNVVFSIEGHCDERGTNEYNLALGEKRASTAVGYMSRLGVSTSGISTISYGEERPTCMQSAESCWSQNRRAHFLAVAVN